MSFYQVMKLLIPFLPYFGTINAQEKAPYYLAGSAEVIPDSSLKSYLYKYPNGLQLIVIPQQKSAFASLYINIDAGSNREKNTQDAGVAHFLEHMFFLNAKGFKDKQFENEINALGAETNAHTFKNYVRYYINFPSPAFDRILKLQANMLLNLEIKPEAFSKEKNIILNERSLASDTDVYQKFSSKINSLIYKNTSYEIDILGTEQTIKEISIPQLKEFYSKYYTPSNTIIVVSGNFKHTEVAEKVSQNFKNWKKSSQPQAPQQKLNYSNKVFTCLDKDIQKNIYTLFFLNNKFSIKDYSYFQVLRYILSIKNNSFKNQLFDQNLIEDFYVTQYYTNGVLNDEIKFTFELDKNQDFILVKNLLLEKLKELGKLKLTQTEQIKMSDYFTKEIALDYEKTFNRNEFIAFNYFYFGTVHFETEFMNIIKNLDYPDFVSWLNENLINKKYLLTKLLYNPKQSMNCSEERVSQ